jgi:di/tricarboxylate transporter
VYGSGKLTISDMIKAGFVLNIFGIIIITSAYVLFF